MRAAILYGKEDIRIETISPFPLSPGEVRIQIKVALTCGTDLKVYKRGYHARMIVPPSVFGHELSGVISEVHPNVRNWTVGEPVVVANSAPCGNCFFCANDQENLCDDLHFLNGAYAEYIAIPERFVQKNLLRVPAGITFADAALAEPLACVVHAADELKITQGERVLILGSGPIALMFGAIAKNSRATVVLAGRGKSRLTTANRLGLETLEIPPGTNLLEEIKKMNRTFDIVIEAIGTAETWEAAIQLVRKGGRVNLFGGCPSGTSVKFDSDLIHYSNITLFSSFHHTPATFRKALGYIENGVISARHLVDGSCSLSELPELFRSMAAGNKVVKTAILMQSDGQDRMRLPEEPSK